LFVVLLQGVAIEAAKNNQNAEPTELGNLFVAGMIGK
jgi:hypothetical protein